MRKKIYKKRIRKGFNLTELILASVMIIAILSAAYITMIYGQRSFDYEQERVKLNANAILALQVITQSIRSASQAEIADNGKIVRIYHDEDWIEYKYKDKGIKVKTKDGGSIEKALVEDVVEYVDFSVDPETKTTIVEIHLKKGKDLAKVSSSVAMRNSETGPTVVSTQKLSDNEAESYGDDDDD